MWNSSFLSINNWEKKESYARKTKYLCGTNRVGGPPARDLWRGCVFHSIPTLFPSHEPPLPPRRHFSSRLLPMRRHSSCPLCLLSDQPLKAGMALTWKLPPSWWGPRSGSRIGSISEMWGHMIWYMLRGDVRMNRRPCWEMGCLGPDKHH